MAAMSKTHEIGKEILMAVKGPHPETNSVKSDNSECQDS